MAVRGWRPSGRGCTGTGRKYLHTNKLPSELKQPRDWWTRLDPFKADWADIERRLGDAPELEARTLFEDLMRRRPGVYQEGQLRTFQRLAGAPRAG